MNPKANTPDISAANMTAFVNVETLAAACITLNDPQENILLEMQVQDALGNICFATSLEPEAVIDDTHTCQGPWKQSQSVWISAPGVQSECNGLVVNGRRLTLRGLERGKYHVLFSARAFIASEMSAAVVKSVSFTVEQVAILRRVVDCETGPGGTEFCGCAGCSCGRLVGLGIVQGLVTQECNSRNGESAGCHSLLLPIKGRHIDTTPSCLNTKEMSLHIQATKGKLSHGSVDWPSDRYIINGTANQLNDRLAQEQALRYTSDVNHNGLINITISLSIDGDVVLHTTTISVCIEPMNNQPLLVPPDFKAASTNFIYTTNGLQPAWEVYEVAQHYADHGLAPGFSPLHVDCRDSALLGYPCVLHVTPVLLRDQDARFSELYTVILRTKYNGTVAIGRSAVENLKLLEGEFSGSSKLVFLGTRRHVQKAFNNIWFKTKAQRLCVDYVDIQVLDGTCTNNRPIQQCVDGGSIIHPHDCGPLTTGAYGSSVELCPHTEHGGHCTFWDKLSSHAICDKRLLSCHNGVYLQHEWQLDTWIEVESGSQSIHTDPMSGYHAGGMHALGCYPMPTTSPTPVPTPNTTQWAISCSSRSYVIATGYGSWEECDITGPFEGSRSGFTAFGTHQCPTITCISFNRVTCSGPGCTAVPTLERVYCTAIPTQSPTHAPIARRSPRTDDEMCHSNVLTLTMKVELVNDAPVITAPITVYSGLEDTDISLTNITIHDEDATLLGSETNIELLIESVSGSAFVFFDETGDVPSAAFFIEGSRKGNARLRVQGSQHTTAHHSTAHHSTAQHTTAQHITAQHSTQHSTAQHSNKAQYTYLPIFMAMRDWTAAASMSGVTAGSSIGSSRLPSAAA